MNFRTEYIPTAQPPIDLRRPVLMMGSCFTDNVGGCLRRRMVNVCHNPTGTLFNPQSIANVINAALDGTRPEYINHDGIWNSWLLPSEFSSPDRDTALSLGEAAFASLHDALDTAGTIIVTFGTAIVYALTSPPFTVVSNCHKRPAATFFRDMLPVEAIVSVWDKLIERIRRTNPDVRFIFTVSPVRHLKEGFHANTLSKSTLHLAIAALERLHAQCGYFAAYEIMTDDLRDYRFCASDMQHPSPQAVDYIYGKFAETFFTDSDRKLLDRAEKLTRRREHRPLHPDSDDARRFADETEHQLSLLLTEAPWLRP